MIPRISVLMYHQVGHFASMKSHRATYCRLDRFETQMAWLARIRTPVLTLDECLEVLAGRRQLRRSAVVLTFDDAYENFADNALPVLRRHGFQATVYVPAGFIGGRAEWLAADGLYPAAIMTGACLRELASAGDVCIGAHGVHHLRLGEIPPEQAWEELAGAKSKLEAVLEREVRHCCYPYGSVTPRVMQLAAEAGYASATTCQRGALQADSDPLGLARKAISYGDNLLGFIWKVHFKHALKGEPLVRPGIR